MAILIPSGHSVPTLYRNSLGRHLERLTHTVGYVLQLIRNTCSLWFAVFPPWSGRNISMVRIFLIRVQVIQCNNILIRFIFVERFCSGSVHAFDCHQNVCESRRRRAQAVFVFFVFGIMFSSFSALILFATFALVGKAFTLPFQREQQICT